MHPPSKKNRQGAAGLNKPAREADGVIVNATTPVTIDAKKKRTALSALDAI